MKDQEVKMTQYQFKMLQTFLEDAPDSLAGRNIIHNTLMIDVKTVVTQSLIKNKVLFWSKKEKIYHISLEAVASMIRHILDTQGCSSAFVFIDCLTQDYTRIYEV